MNDHDPESGSQVQLSKDAIFDVLSNARRRYMIEYLHGSGEPVELGKLAWELAAWENDTTVEELTKPQRKRVYVSLYQTHIRKLVEMGIVEYDEATGMVELRPAADQVSPHLYFDPEDQAPEGYETIPVPEEVFQQVLSVKNQYGCDSLAEAVATASTIALQRDEAALARILADRLSK